MLIITFPPLYLLANPHPLFQPLLIPRTPSRLAPLSIYSYLLSTSILISYRLFCYCYSLFYCYCPLSNLYYSHSLLSLIYSLYHFYDSMFSYFSSICLLLSFSIQIYNIINIINIHILLYYTIVPNIII